MHCSRALWIALCEHKVKTSVRSLFWGNKQTRFQSISWMSRICPYCHSRFQCSPGCKCTPQRSRFLCGYTSLRGKDHRLRTKRWFTIDWGFRKCPHEDTHHNDQPNSKTRQIFGEHRAIFQQQKELILSPCTRYVGVLPGTQAFPCLMYEAAQSADKQENTLGAKPFKTAIFFPLKIY